MFSVYNIVYNIICVNIFSYIAEKTNIKKDTTK